MKHSSVCGQNFIPKNMFEYSQFDLTLNVHNHGDDILNDIFSRLTTLIISTCHAYGENNNNTIASTPIYFIYSNLVLSGVSSDCYSSDILRKDNFKLEFPIFFSFRISEWNQEKENGWAGERET